jgi:hypothetical protein
VLRCEAKIPFKKKLEDYLDLQERRIFKTNIVVRLNTEVKPELASGLNADVIIAALGSRPVKPLLKGMTHIMYSERRRFTIIPKRPGKAASYSAADLWLELAVFLSEEGRKVTVVEMLRHSRLGEDGGTLGAHEDVTGFRRGRPYSSGRGSLRKNQDTSRYENHLLPQRLYRLHLWACSLRIRRCFMKSKPIR